MIYIQYQAFIAFKIPSYISTSYLSLSDLVSLSDSLSVLSSDELRSKSSFILD